MYVKKTERTMQLVWALGVKLAEVYSGQTQIFSLYSLPTSFLKLFFFFFGSLCFDWDTS